MKLIELYNQSRLKEWTEYELYVETNGIEMPVNKYDRDTKNKKILLHASLKKKKKKRKVV